MPIAVAISGGMDSLLTLALLAEAGQSVTALHAHFLPPDDSARALAQALDAQCRSMGVPFHAVDLSKQFRQRVIDPFVAAYASGLTPNPCAACNRDMKFGLLFAAAKGLGAARLATGHYARTTTGLDADPCATPNAGSVAGPDTGPAVPCAGPCANSANGQCAGPNAGSVAGPDAGSLAGSDSAYQGLYRGLDPVKDQSYFLSLVPQSALERAVFPLGTWRKADVPAALAARRLAPPLPGESQEVCFIPGDDYRAFLESQETALSGPGLIQLEDGRTIGRHLGLWRYTIGQRRGLNVAWSEPLYVLEKRQDQNVLIAGPKQRLLGSECRAAGLNLQVDPAQWPETVLAQTCYRQRALPATAVVAGGLLRLTFHTAIPRPTPGQVAAVYDASGRVLAGGIIL